MTAGTRNNLWLGALCAGLALVLIVGVIPFDTETGLVEKVRRRVRIGDALAPTIAAGFILLGGAMLMIFERSAVRQPGICGSTWRFLAALLGVLLIGLVVMRYAGPLAVTFQEAGEYRLLRDTYPWKYIGFALGGLGIVAGLIMLVERRFSLRAVVVAVGVVLALIALFDLPFGDLLLPPNGDV